MTNEIVKAVAALQPDDLQSHAVWKYVNRDSDDETLVWRFESETGLPSTQDAQRMNDLEDALAPHVTNDGFATLAIVSTGDGVREWTYYADSGTEFVARLNVALSSLPPFPIEIHEAMDPEWQYYNGLLASLQGRSPYP